MIARLTSLWLTIVTATLISTIASAVMAHIFYRETPENALPLITRIFYPDKLLVYLYPLPLGLLALTHTLRSRSNQSHSIFLITLNLCLSIIFIAALIMAIITPILPL